MIKNNYLHIIISLIVMAVLLSLYQSSQIDQKKNLAITKNILEIKESDLKLNQSIIQNQTGLHKNFDAISQSQRLTKNILAELNKSLYEYRLTNTQLDSELLQLTTLENKKFELVSQYKKTAAVNKFTKQYIPNAFKILIEDIENLTTIKNNKKLFIIEEISQLNININRYIAGYEKNEERLKLMSNAVHENILGLLAGNSTNLNLLTGYIKKVLENNNETKALVQKIQDIKTSENISLIQNNYETLFNTENKTAIKFKKLLFISSITLLFYLIVIFGKLKSTSNSLKDTLLDLEFRKQAINEHAIVSITDIKGNIIYVNSKFCDVSQYTHKELIGKNHRIIKSDHHDKKFFKIIWQTITNGKKWQDVICNIAKDGSTYWVETTILPRINTEGIPYEYISIGTDITAQKLAEFEVTSLAKFPIENPEPVIRVDKSGEITFQNKAAKLILEHRHGDKDNHINSAWLRIVNEALTKNETYEHEINVNNLYYILKFTPVVCSDYVNIYGLDVTERKKAEESLSYQANHDNLTGLVNRYAFERELNNALTLAKVKNSQHILLYIDLDQFKIVNDTCGHIAGDELLRQLSNMMLSIFRENDTLARLGGDEFGVLLLNCNLEKGNKIAEKLLDLVNHYRFIWEEQVFEVGASIGLVRFDKDSQTITNVLGNADVACYAAKDGGRNQINIYDSEGSDSVQRHKEIQWASKIPKALAENRFQLMVQSIIPLGTENNLKPHFEILLRMLDEDGSLIPPGLFIPAAERYNLMHAIDHWVVVHTFQFLNNFSCDNDSDELPRLAINLSGESLGNEELLAFIRAQVEVNKIPAKNICFEITETAAIGNLNKAIDFISNLKELGFEFALDDFGSGLSSFSYLKSLPVDYLKIDGIFVKDIATDPIDKAMVESINQVGHIMNIKTIAEFVENEEIMNCLSEIGVDYAQGYHIDKPTPIEEKFPLKSDSNIIQIKSKR